MPWWGVALIVVGSIVAAVVLVVSIAIAVAAWRVIVKGIKETEGPKSMAAQVKKGPRR